jgi:hypothetical protein
MLNVRIGRWRRQPRVGRLRPEDWSDLALPQFPVTYFTGSRLSALPSAISELARTTATNTVDRPATPRRNHADRVQGNIKKLSAPDRAS